MQDAFLVIEGASATRSLFSPRGKERHVFLFEKVIIFSKKIEAPEDKRGKKKPDAYLYKGHLDVSVGWCIKHRVLMLTTPGHIIYMILHYWLPIIS